MGRAWKNHPCTFNTINTLNTFGNSSYVVTEDSVTRNAPINRDRAPGQVDNRALTRAICYLDTTGKLFKLVEREPEDSNITIHDVKGDQIWVKVHTMLKDGEGALLGVDPETEYYGIASRVPVSGHCTFDFENKNGVLSGIHIGHKVDGGTLR
jgi:hypothetical protein